MTDPELQELADLWQERDDEESAKFELMARKARRQGRFLAYADVGLAALLIGGSLFFLFISPGPFTTAAALALLGATLWLTWQRRKLRQMVRTLNTADRPTFLANSVRNARADLRRVTLTLAALPPLVISALLMKMGTRSGDAIHPVDYIVNWAQTPRGMISLAIFALIALHALRSRRKIKKELEWLEDLRRSYEQPPEEEQDQQ
jgi:hypothetical protein